MITYKMKSGDAGRTIQASLYADGIPYNLVTSTVRLVAKRASTGISTTMVGTILSAANGTVRATVDSLLTVADSFNLEWEVTDGVAILSFPSNGYDRLVVDADLD